MRESVAVTGRTDLGMQFPQRGRDRYTLGFGDVAARAVTHIFDLDTLLETAPLGMLDSGVARPNVVITCELGELDAIVARLKQVAVQPVHTCVVTDSPRVQRAAQPELGEMLGSVHDGTLIVHDLARLDMAQQIALFDWMAQQAGRTQVIGLTTIALAPLVERGLFLQALYSRLSTLQAVSAATTPPDVSRAHGA